MYYAYILKSLSNGTFYYGSTEDIQKRLKYHNGGKSKYTKPLRPWVIHYYETFETETEALTRERFFKTYDGYKWLKENGVV